MASAHLMCLSGWFLLLTVDTVVGMNALDDRFGFFHCHLQQLHSRPRTAARRPWQQVVVTSCTASGDWSKATPLSSLLELQLELCMYILALNTGATSTSTWSTGCSFTAFYSYEAHFSEFFPADPTCTFSRPRLLHGASAEHGGFTPSSRRCLSPGAQVGRGGGGSYGSSADAGHEQL